MNMTPNIISTKDLSYISDMFDWNFNAGKIARHYSKEVVSEEIKNFILQVYNLHVKNCQKCIQMLGGNYE